MKVIYFFVLQDLKAVTFSISIFPFKQEKTLWTKAVGVGQEVNTVAGAGSPTLSPDAKYLFFKKTKEPHRGIYWISTKIFEELKPVELKH